MVKNGLQDWIIQRVSAIVVGAYSLFIFAFLICHANLTYATWHALFDHTVVKIISLITLLLVMMHAWVGIWTVFTDYVKPQVLRLILQAIVIIALVYYFFWGVQILWGFA